MDIYLSEEEAKKIAEEMEKDGTFPVSVPEFPKEFTFDKVIMNHSKKQYGSSIRMKEGVLLCQPNSI